MGRAFQVAARRRDFIFGGRLDTESAQHFRGTGSYGGVRRGHLPRGSAAGERDLAGADRCGCPYLWIPSLGAGLQLAALLRQPDAIRLVSWHDFHRINFTLGPSRRELGMGRAIFYPTVCRSLLSIIGPARLASTSRQRAALHPDFRGYAGGPRWPGDPVVTHPTSADPQRHLGRSGNVVFRRQSSPRPQDRLTREGGNAVRKPSRLNQPNLFNNRFSHKVIIFTKIILPSGLSAFIRAAPRLRK